MNELKMTREDMERIASAVGAMAIAMNRNAKTSKEVDEAIELFLLHVRLVNAIAKADEMTKDDE